MKLLALDTAPCQTSSCILIVTYKVACFPIGILQQDLPLVPEWTAILSEAVVLLWHLVLCSDCLHCANIHTHTLPVGVLWGPCVGNQLAVCSGRRLLLCFHLLVAELLQVSSG